MITQNYFDYAAATPMNSEVVDSMLPYFSDDFFNPSSDYLNAKKIAKDIQTARQDIASCLGVKPTEIIFTAGGTEANNLAISGVAEKYSGSTLACSVVEHKSVIAPTLRYKHKLLEVDKTGVINLSKLKQEITDDVVLVSLILANNEIGTIMPMKETSRIIQKIRDSRKSKKNNLPLLLHTDASQAGNYLSLKPYSLGVDMMTINGGKIYGPKQSGILYVKTGIDIHPLVIGGGQERGLRSGTENVAGIIGFAKALIMSQNLREQELKRMQKLHKLFVRELNQNIPNAIINGSKKRLPNNLHITVPGIDNERVMMILDERGYQVAVGSACNASSEEPSHVLRAIGLSDKDARSSLRFTMGSFTSEESIKGLIKNLSEICG